MDRCRAVLGVTAFLLDLRRPESVRWFCVQRNLCLVFFFGLLLGEVVPLSSFLLTPILSKSSLASRAHGSPLFTNTFPTSRGGLHAQVSSIGTICVDGSMELGLVVDDRGHH